MEDKRPVTAIVCEDGFDGPTGNFVLRKAYTSGIADAGGLPVAAVDVRNVKDYADSCDGLLLTGGIPVHPARYGGIIPTLGESFIYSLARDDLDFAILDAFIKRGKPVWGLGRGFEVIASYYGGSFTLDRTKEAERSAGKRGPIDSDRQSRRAGGQYESITARENSLCSRVFGSEGKHLYLHSRKLKDHGSVLIPSGFNENGETEALESENGEILAVYWHPESGDDAERRAFFSELVKAERI